VYADLKLLQKNCIKSTNCLEVVKATKEAGNSHFSKIHLQWTLLIKNMLVLSPQFTDLKGYN